MNSCCTQPLEAIADNNHKNGEDCCLVNEKASAPAKAACPVCGTLARRVQRRTVAHLVEPEKREGIRNVQYYYCMKQSCEVVYYSNENVPFFTADDVEVKVYAKDSGDDVPVCYCFDWTRGRIKQQIIETGKSSAALEIAGEVKAGNCVCDVKNPKGQCCLGDVNAFVKETMRMSTQV
jgi:hypothetical protein